MHHWAPETTENFQNYRIKILANFLNTLYHEHSCNEYRLEMEAHNIVPIVALSYPQSND